jgi:DNA-binding SARP family transcriptional activator
VGATVEITGVEQSILPAIGTPDIELGLLRGFRLRHGAEIVALPLGAQRVLAYLALHDRPVLRNAVAGALWLETSDVRAAANLRSALWRLNLPGLELITATVAHLCLSPGVDVDIRQADRFAHAVLERHVSLDHAERPALQLGGDFLPDWPDAWVMIERERFRQLRLHALEALCEQLTLDGRFGQAVDAGLAAVAAEPLRESAHRVLIAAYLAEGNKVEAVRQFRFYQQLAQQELDVQPSALMRDLFTASEAQQARCG